MARSRKRKSSVDAPRVIVVDATRGNLTGALATITDTLVEVLSAVATMRAEVKARIEDRDVTETFDALEREARERGHAAVETLAGMPVGAAVLAVGAALHEVVEAYKAAYEEISKRIAPGERPLREAGCGHTKAEHDEMAATIVDIVTGTPPLASAQPSVMMCRMRGRDATH